MGNVIGCCGHADQVDDDSTGQQVVITSRKPSVQCEGYAPAMLPKFLTSQEIVDFYLFYQEKGEACQLACGLIRCVDNCQARSTNWTWVQSSFDIDSTKPVIILCHGYMSWRNQMLLAFLAGHLSRKLHCHVLRFDFSGNGHSNGEWKYAGYDAEARDLDQVIRFAREQLKCQVSCVIGHSKGAISVLRRAWEQEAMPADDRIPCFVNLSGPFYLPGDFSEQDRFTKEQLQDLETTGKILLETRGQKRHYATKQDIKDKKTLNSSLARGIQTSRVLTIHGDADDVVDVSSAYKFADTIKPHELKIIKGGDHAFNGLRHMDELTNTISAFVERT